MEKTRIVLIGCGGMASGHLKSLGLLHDKGYTDFEIVAFCDIIKSHAQDFSTKYEEMTGQSVPVVVGVDTLLASDIQFDAAALMLPHVEHHRETIKLIKAGKDIMSEKPLGITLRAAKMIMDAAKKLELFYRLQKTIDYPQMRER